MERPLLGLARSDSREGTQLQWTDPGGDPLSLDPLHDEVTVGTFAIVYRGRVAHGSWHVPVAIKVQRDEPRMPEDPESVVARFNAEAKLHRDRLRTRDADGRVPLPVVAQIELSANVGDEADRIRPSILCRRARHALALLCPKCGAELQSPEELFDLASPAPPVGRVLVCPKRGCSGPWKDTPDSRRTLHATSVARQPEPCGHCERFSGPAEACLGDSRILNFFPARLLIFELLGESLAQFLRRRSPSGSRFPPLAVGRPTRPLEWLTTACHLLSDILDGMEFLHARQVWHLDLKPDNVCLRPAPDRPRGVLIDLGLASDREAPARFREAMTPHKLETDYAPAELQRPTLAGNYVVEKRSVSRVRVRFDLPSAAAGPTNPILLVGETVHLTDTGLPVRGVVEQVGGGQAVIAFEGVEPAARGQLTVFRATGPAADYFSFGLLGAALLVGRPELTDLHDLARNLEVALRELDKVGPLAVCPGREVVRRLAVASNVTQFLPEFLRLLAAVRKDYGPAAYLAEELLGLSLRCLARGVKGWSASEHRAACSDDARRQVRRSLDGLRESVAAAELEERWAAVERTRRERAAMLRELPVRAPVNGQPIGNGDLAGLREVVALLPVQPTPDAVEVRHAARIYADASGLLGPHLDRLFDAPRPDGNDGPLVQLIVWARGVTAGAGDVPRLLELRRQIANPRLGIGAQVLADADRIAALIADSHAAAGIVRDALSAFRSLVYNRPAPRGRLVSIDEAHAGIAMNAAHVASASLAEGVLARLLAERDKLLQDGTVAMNRWRTTASPLLRASLLAFEKNLEAGLRRVAQEDARWAVVARRDAAVVTTYLDAITAANGLWSRWVAEAERKLNFWERTFQRPKRLELTPREADSTELDTAMAALTRLDHALPGPALCCKCRLLVVEAKTILQSQKFKGA